MQGSYGFLLGRYAFGGLLGGLTSRAGLFQCCVVLGMTEPRSVVFSGTYVADKHSTWQPTLSNSLQAAFFPYPSCASMSKAKSPSLDQ